MFQINEFDRNGNLIGKSSFENADDVDFFLPRARARAAQITVWDMDREVMLNAVCDDARSAKHDVRRIYAHCAV